MSSERPSEQLLPCPHCGCDVEVLHIEAHEHYIATFMPPAPDTYVIECPCGAGMCGHESAAEVSLRWNQRTVR